MRTFSWLNPKLKTQKTKHYGGGVFAIKNIKKDDLLAIFGGHVLTLEEEEKLPKAFSDTGVQISENFVLTSMNKKEDTDYFNHSCNPNAGFKGQIFLIAMRDIKISEEVTFDYAMVLHKKRGAKCYRFKCLCGSVDCRGYVTDNDWKNIQLQKKYFGFFQYYIQEKISKKLN